MKNSILSLVVFASGVVFAEPVISELQIRQLPNRTVEVDYNLSEDGFVSVDFQTNGVSIGCSNFANVTGDCNRVVSAGACKITWKARKSWPDHKGEMTARLQAVATNATPDYLIVDLATGFRTYRETNEGWSPAFGDDVYKTDKLVMKRVHAAGVEWSMGCATNTLNYASVYQAHQVVLTHDYYMGVYELTQRQWELVMTGNTKGISTRPSFYSNEVYYATRPVESVSPMYEIIADSGQMHEYPDSPAVLAEGWFLSAIRQRTGLPFNLPTSAQWEYACRAGSRSSAFNGYEYRMENTLSAAANYGRCGKSARTSNDGEFTPEQGGTCAVGTLIPNDWGFYDMFGNVREMTLDWFLPMNPPAKYSYLNDLAQGTVVDPRGISWKEAKAEGQICFSLQCRGGHYANSTDKCQLTPWHFEAQDGDGGDISKRIPETGLRLIIEL